MASEKHANDNSVLPQKYKNTKDKTRHIHEL